MSAISRLAEPLMLVAILYIVIEAGVPRLAVAVLLYRFLIVGELPSQREIREQLVPMVLGRSPDHGETSSTQPRHRARRTRAVNR